MNKLVVLLAILLSYSAAAQTPGYAFGSQEHTYSGKSPAAQYFSINGRTYCYSLGRWYEFYRGYWYATSSPVAGAPYPRAPQSQTYQTASAPRYFSYQGRYYMSYQGRYYIWDRGRYYVSNFTPPDTDPAASGRVPNVGYETQPSYPERPSQPSYQAPYPKSQYPAQPISPDTGQSQTQQQSQQQQSQRQQPDVSLKDVFTGISGVATIIKGLADLDWILDALATLF